MKRYVYPECERTLLEGLKTPLAVFQWVDGQIATLILSDGFCRLLGVRDRARAYAAMDRDTYKNVFPDDVARVADAVYRFMREGGRFDALYRLKEADGSLRLIHAQGEHVTVGDGVRLAQVWYTDEGLYSENAEQPGSRLTRALSEALHEEILVRASRFDDLTGLPNMTCFFELAEAGKAALLSEGAEPALLYMDLGGMKYFNTRYGFAEGDKLLRAFARVLAGRFGSDHCSHFSADHFLAYTRVDGLEDTLQQLFDECAGMNDGLTLPVRVGIYTHYMDDVPASTACDRAKIACDAIKNSFASGYNYYSAEMQAEAERRQYILTNLDRAIAEKWIQVYYQPIMRAVNGRVSDDEALSRWIDPVKGMLSPAEFIPILEDAGVIYKLDLYVLEQVLEKLRGMKAMGLTIVPQSINLSRSDFDACDIVEEIRRRVDAAGVGRGSITIEITESVVGSDFEFMKAQIGRFRALGFPVWMDDFGSGYSSLDVLQSLQFDLVKFDMGFMRRLDESDSGRIMLTELMKMATALGIGTVCEGVETEAQARFLQEIGCSKLQGYYYSRPVPLDTLIERYAGHPDGAVGYENPDEAPYYDAIGSVNLYDLTLIAGEEERRFLNVFDTLPMGIIEVRGDETRFLRSNQSYRDFIRHYFHFDLSCQGSAFAKYDAAFVVNIVRTCCERGIRSFYDEKMPDGSVVHSFARRVGVNPVNGSVAVAVAVLSITDPGEGATYAEIARALAADYYNIYVVDLDTEHFIEYSSPVGGQEMAMERHGEGFFESARRDTMTRIFPDDREPFLAAFSKEQIVRDLDERGVFTATYRLIDSGAPMYANMKITRMQPGGSRIIIGISIVDAQMKKGEKARERQIERGTLTRLIALDADYLSLYTIDPETGHYTESSASDDYRRLGFAQEGEDFFYRGIEDGRKTVFHEDLPEYLARFNRENVLREIAQNGVFKLQYRLVIDGEPRPVSLRIAAFREGGEEKLVAGVRAWRMRKKSYK